MLLSFEVKSGSVWKDMNILNREMHVLSVCKRKISDFF